MKIYTSYFAQMRNFPPNMISFSTATWNPKWLSKNDPHIWLDIPPLKPGEACEGLCNGKCANKQPEFCAFLKTYRKQLDMLDFNEIVSKIKAIALKIQQEEHFNGVDVAILVYETPRNKCSERIVIQQWFKDNGIEVAEWER